MSIRSLSLKAIFYISDMIKTNVMFSLGLEIINSLGINQCPMINLIARDYSKQGVFICAGGIT